jgi:micrococcal nuclease
MGLLKAVRAALRAAFTVDGFDSRKPCRVTYCFDGDTVKVTQGDYEERVRLIGIDAPEIGWHGKEEDLWAPESREFLRDLVQGEVVRLRLEGDRYDKYDRLLAYIYRQSDDLFVNAEMIRQGWAWSYEYFPFSQKWLFRKCQREARAARRGIWQYEPESMLVIVGRWLAGLFGKGDAAP